MVLLNPILNKGYKLLTDASDYALGSILTQENKNGDEKNHIM